MGTASTTKFIKNTTAGQLTEEAALTTSAGAGDAQKIPALNASGILDPTIINGKNTSAGVGDAAKVPLLNASGILDDTIINASVTSSAGKIVKLDGSGKLDSTVMPVGIGADTSSIIASEALAAGDLVNIYNNAGTANCRKADANTVGKEAHGFVLVGVASLAAATVYFEGSNTAQTTLTPGNQFLSATTAGKATATAPTGTGKIVQRVGFATSATSFNFQSNDPIVLA
jgi:hypothetical protein